MPTPKPTPALTITPVPDEIEVVDLSELAPRFRPDAPAKAVASMKSAAKVGRFPAILKLGLKSYVRKPDLMDWYRTSAQGDVRGLVRDEDVLVNPRGAKA